MRIAPTTRAPAAPRSVLEPPVTLDDMGTVRAVLDAPTTDGAWLALTGGGARRGLLAARLVATRGRCAAATHATAGALLKIRERREAVPGPLPASWVARLGDLMVEEMEALWAADDACHTAAIEEPEWVALPRGERAIHPDEASWARISRLVARQVQMTAGMALDDEQYDRLMALEVERACAADDADRVRDGARAAVRLAVTAKYGGEG